ncbi:hypothetical protein F4810DRAFT_650254, partial [Camillea tinctor]
MLCCVVCCSTTPTNGFFFLLLFFSSCSTQGTCTMNARFKTKEPPLPYPYGISHWAHHPLFPPPFPQGGDEGGFLVPWFGV